MPLLLALDFGGTKLAAGLIESETGRMVQHIRESSPPDASLSIPLMISMGKSLVEQAGARIADLPGVGISFGGPVDETRRVVRLSHHVPGWENRPLVETMEREFGLPVVMDNDANLQALGEWRYGAGQGSELELFVNVGTGIGGGIVIKGRLHRGRHGLAGEVGHAVVQPDGPTCTCGKRGCLEAMAAGPAIERTALAALDSYPKGGRMLRSILDQNGGRMRGEWVFQAAEAGDDLALGVIRRCARYLGIGIANAAVIVDPDVIVVGGGVSKAGPLFFGPLVEAVRAHAAPLDPESIRVLPGSLGDDANLLGAVSLAEQELVDTRAAAI